MEKFPLVLLGLFLLLGSLWFTVYRLNAPKDKSLRLGKPNPDVPTPVYDLWTHWKIKHGKQYGADEEPKRLGIFYENYQKIEEHMKKPDRSYDMGYTCFMDMTKDEFKSIFLGTKPPVHENIKISDLPTDSLPESIDWRTKKVLTPIKDQGMCGSCWAFSTTGSLEALFAIKGKGLLSFSEQQLVDCSTKQGNEGCNGGLMDYAFTFVKENGITTEDKYPYKAVDQTCKKPTGEYKISGFTDIKQGDITQLQAAVVQQPVSIAVDAEQWQFYSGGVFNDCGDSLDHGVLLVGYDADAWIVKNSWGDSWGESGFIRLKRGNTCGLANAASYPIL